MTSDAPAATRRNLSIVEDLVSQKSIFVGESVSAMESNINPQIKSYETYVRMRPRRAFLQHSTRSVRPRPRLPASNSRV